MTPILIAFAGFVAVVILSYVALIASFYPQPKGKVNE